MNSFFYCHLFHIHKKNYVFLLCLPFFLPIMGLNNIKLLSLNARGIRSFDKRKTIFNWLCKSGADLCFLQETYSSKEVENIWRKQWKVDMFFSHGSSHSRGVLILVKDQLDFKLLSSRVDDQGGYILLHAMIQDTPFLLINIYAPNKCAEQSEFFKSISNEIKTCVTLDCSIVLGGGAILTLPLTQN